MMSEVRACYPALGRGGCSVHVPEQPHQVRRGPPEDHVHRRGGLQVQKWPHKSTTKAMLC